MGNVLVGKVVRTFEWVCEAEAAVGAAAAEAGRLTCVQSIR